MQRGWTCRFEDRIALIDDRAERSAVIEDRGAVIEDGRADSRIELHYRAGRGRC